MSTVELTELERITLSIVKSSEGIQIPKAIDNVIEIAPEAPEWEIRHALERLIELGILYFDMELNVHYRKQSKKKQ